MKNIIYLVILFICMNVRGQELFTSVMQGFTPASLYSANGYLYVGNFENNNGPTRIYGVPLNDPSTKDVISDFSVPPFVGIWKMTYDNARNDLYAYNLVSLHRVDLDQNIPITNEFLIDIQFTCNGIAYKDDFLYLAYGEDIYRMNVTSQSPTIDLFYDLPNGLEPYNPGIFGNELYFATNNAQDYDLYKINISSPNNSLELVSTLEQNTGGVQSSLVADSFLYLGIEGPTHRILKLDLSDTNYPLQEEVLIDNFSGAPIGLARSGNKIFITDGNTQNIFQLTDTTLDNIDNARPLLSIAPNPVADRLYISATENADYSVYTTTGQLIDRSNYSDRGIDVSRLSAGIYFIHLEVNGISQTLKFIKE